MDLSPKLGAGEQRPAEEEATLVPEIFQSIEDIPAGAGGEIQLTDALKHLLRSRPIYGLKFEGKRFNAGDKLGFLQATVECALRRPELRAAVRDYLRTLLV